MQKFFYVSPEGSDRNTGEMDAPFLTIGRAQQAAREYGPCTVKVQEGIYRECLSFSSLDNTCEYIGENAVLVGSVDIPYEDTKEIGENIQERLSADIAAKVRVIDLSAYGYSEEDWGAVYPVGAYHTAGKYDGAEQGVNLEIFSGGKRMILARYPNNGFLKIEEVEDDGDISEFPPHNHLAEWDTMRNPRGGTFIMDFETNRRAMNWKESKNVWLFGYFQYDWADSSTPVEILDTVNRAVSPRYASEFGYKKGADYYFFNILEELDMPGEYYLDRTDGLLYVYPYQEGDQITVSLTEKPLILAEGAEGLIIDGFHLRYTRNNGIDLKGNHCVLRNLLVENVAEYGILVAGSGNIVENCEITQTGRGGIWLKGGDRITLTPGQNQAVNNYIHHFSVLSQTYQPGIYLEGVGNCCAHNEICFCPHAAILYCGNDLLIEYNHIHDAVLYSADAGAIYSGGMNWASHGVVIRYNIVKDVGCDELELGGPHGIYWDDGLSGQTAYGNILINIKDFGFLIGGGRDNTVKNNVVIGENRVSICYDNRVNDGYFKNGWFKNHVKIPENRPLCQIGMCGHYGNMWRSLWDVPYKDGIWAEKYPTLAKVTEDITMEESPDFPINPANIVLEDNIIINPSGRHMSIEGMVPKYSKIGINHFYTSCEEARFDMETLKFQQVPDGFEEIPVEKVGRKQC